MFLTVAMLESTIICNANSLWTKLICCMPILHSSKWQLGILSSSKHSRQLNMISCAEHLNLKRLVKSKLQITTFLFKPTPFTVLMVFGGVVLHQAEQCRRVKLWPRHSNKTPEGLSGEQQIENWF